MPRVNVSRFLVIQCRTSPYVLAGAFKYMVSVGVPPRNSSDLLNCALELLSNAFEMSNGKLFEDENDALDFCASNNLAFSTRLKESKRQKTYEAAKNYINSTNPEYNRKKEIDDSWAEFDSKVSEIMQKEGITKEMAEAKVLMS